MSLYDAAQVGFFLFGIPRNGFGSIDVTTRCNLRCQHCYFFEHDQPEVALDDEAWLAKLQSWKRTRSRLEFPFFQCTWVGGEPLLRRGLIERARRFFRYNTVVTNGTLALPDWPDVNWYVSIDGDEQTHEELRGCRGIYRRILQNVASCPQNRVTIAYCITTSNAHCIEQVVQDWSPVAAHFTFDFYTPMGTGEDPLWVPWPERDRIIQRLLQLKRSLGKDRLLAPERTFLLMRSETAPDVTRNCLFVRKAFAYDALGRPKEKCMMGPKADCARCGCVVPFYLRSLTDRGLIVRDIAGGLHQRARRWFDRSPSAAPADQPGPDQGAAPPPR